MRRSIVLTVVATAIALGGLAAPASAATHSASTRATTQAAAGPARDLGPLVLTAQAAGARAQAGPVAKPAIPDISGVCGGFWGTSWPPPTVALGSVDTTAPSAVMLAQCYLNLSLNPATHTPLVIDGRFGPLTRAAVRTFQSSSCANVPPVDGIVGPLTWSALRSWANSAFYAC